MGSDEIMVRVTQPRLDHWAVGQRFFIWREFESVGQGDFDGGGRVASNS